MAELERVSGGGRGGYRPVVPTADGQMLPGDEVYFVVDGEGVARGMGAFGDEELEARRLVMFGGGNIGLFLAQEIERDHSWVKAKIIETSQERAEKISGMLERTMVICGDVLDPEILEAANGSATETVVAVTNDDDTNTLTTPLAKRY